MTPHDAQNGQLILPCIYMRQHQHGGIIPITMVLFIPENQFNTIVLQLRIPNIIRQNNRKSDQNCYIVFFYFFFYFFFSFYSFMFINNK